MPTSAMIDIETLATDPAAVILSIGAVKFDPYTTKDPHAKTLWRPDIDEQATLGRSISDDTLTWWSKQDAAIRDATFTSDNRISLDETCKALNKYLVGVDKIWCQGPQFDMVIIENMYDQIKHHTGWQFWQIMDCRTLFNCMPVDPRKAIQQNLHSAEEDAYWQAVCVQQSFAHLGIMPR